jgi:NAD(P)-dependent dehydrogenase (short-subunit alcohol dehydrogenase family)
MTESLQGKRVLVIGRGSGIVGAVVAAARAAGANVIAVGRDDEKLTSAYDDPQIAVETVDVTENPSIAALPDDWRHRPRRMHSVGTGPRETCGP